MSYSSRLERLKRTNFDATNIPTTPIIEKYTKISTFKCPVELPSNTTRIKFKNPFKMRPPEVLRGDDNGRYYCNYHVTNGRPKYSFMPYIDITDDHDWATLVVNDCIDDPNFMSNLSRKQNKHFNFITTTIIIPVGTKEYDSKMGTYYYDCFTDETRPQVQTITEPFVPSTNPTYDL